MIRLSLLLTLLAAFCTGRLLAAPEAPDFNRDIRPILSENGFHCHGPDAKAREADLRLDTFHGATTGGEFADPVVPGKPGESEVIVRINTDDPDEIMPPPDAKRTLTTKQKTLLRDWIASGAEYEDHWAWVTPQRPPAPTILLLLGIDHERLTFRYQGRQFLLTDVHGKVIKDVMA